MNLAAAIGPLLRIGGLILGAKEAVEAFAAAEAAREVGEAKVRRIAATRSRPLIDTDELARQVVAELQVEAGNQLVRDAARDHPNIAEVGARFGIAEGFKDL